MEVLVEILFIILLIAIVKSRSGNKSYPVYKHTLSYMPPIQNQNKTTECFMGCEAEEPFVAGLGNYSRPYIGEFKS
jgi:hypothetical protein